MVSGHDCDGPVTLIIEDPDYSHIPESPAVDVGFAIPVSGEGIAIHERKEGPVAISRRAEADFPMQGLGENWFEYISAFKEGGRIQRTRVKMDFPDGSHSTVFQGYIGSVGASGDNIGHLTMFGPYNLFNSIPVGGRISASGGFVDGVLQWVAEKFVNGQPIFDEVEPVLVEPDLSKITVDSAADEFVAGAGAIGGGAGAAAATALTSDGVSRAQFPGTEEHLDGFKGSNSFSANRDTLTDVVKWIEDHYNVSLWFEPTEEDRVVLAAEYSKGNSIRDPPFETGVLPSLTEITVHDATHDGDIDIISNNALYEMKPYNAITLKGQEKKDVAGLGVGQGIPVSSGNYPEATAFYPPLVERAGGRITMEQNSAESTQKSLAQSARKRLKQALDGVSGGTMLLPLHPNISPYEKILAQPACAGRFDVSLPDLRYEVQRTTHSINPNNQDNQIPVTELAVSMSIDPEKIETETTLKSTTPAEGADNEPKEDDWFDNLIDLGIV